MIEGSVCIVQVITELKLSTESGTGPSTDFAIDCFTKATVWRWMHGTQ